LVFLENLTALVLWLLLTVLWVNILFIAFLAYRRVTRMRYYEAKDAARERYGAVIAQFVAGDVTAAATAVVLRNATTPAEVDAIHDNLFAESSSWDPEAATELLIALGSVERWARQAYGRRRAKEIVVRALSREPVTLPKAVTRDMFAPLQGMRVRSVLRAKAVYALGRLAPEVALVFAAEALRDPSPEVRRLAIAAMGRNGHPGAIPMIVEEIEKGVSQGNDISLRSAKSALVGYRLEHLHYFIPYLRHKNGRLRFFVVDTIRDICRRKSESGMLNKNDFPIELYQLCLDELVKDENPDVRARTAGVIRYFRDARSTAALRHLLRDENEFVRLHAVRACADRHAPELMPDLAERLGDTRWRVREATGTALSVFGQPGEDHLFRYFIQSTDRYACEQLAAEMQRSGLVTDLLPSLIENNPRVELVSGVFQKLVLLEKDSMLLQAVTTPELPVLTRMRLLDIVMVAPRHETMDALSIVMETDEGELGEKAAALMELAHEEGVSGAHGVAGAGGPS
jgi:HEAT repeat protein